MAKNNPGDILTGDWNPVVGCDRASLGCRKCWFLDGIFGWQQRLGNIPPEVSPHQAFVFEKRMTIESLKPKKGIVGVVQHGDLFWEKVDLAIIHRTLDLIEEVAVTKKKIPKYVLWSKRAERMAKILIDRYPQGLPEFFAVSVSVENQLNADGRLPHLMRIPAQTRIIMMEPMLGPIDVSRFSLPEWIVVGSETGGDDAVPLELDWVRQVRDRAVSHKIPFFIKQLGQRHDTPVQALDGRTWDQFPVGFQK